jgi:hypothetical protein
MTSRLVAQCLNQLRHRVLSTLYNITVFHEQSTPKLWFAFIVTVSGIRNYFRGKEIGSSVRITFKRSTVELNQKWGIIRCYNRGELSVAIEIRYLTNRKEA